MVTIKQLFDTLQERKRPEDVAEMVLGLIENSLTTNQRLVLEAKAKGSLVKNFWGYTSMVQEFAKTKGAEKQVIKAIEIFQLQNIERTDYTISENIEKFIQEVSLVINKQVGHNNFKHDRLTKTQRKEIGLDLSKRSYNKKWRILKNLEKKLLTIIRENKKNEFQRISKHGIVHHLDFDNFSKDLNTACFIAYYNSRCNLRSVFTNTSQEQPFDKICEVLLDRCKRKQSAFLDFFKHTKSNQSNSTNWLAISYIYTSQEVLSNLSDEEKGKLLGKWTTILQNIANLLEEVWDKSSINKQTMIVKRGNDSTTWNNTAGAWNKARDNWMNLIYALGLDYILEGICFGKVLRLMAADVAMWHSVSGGKLDPNTEVWNKLPLPWRVFEGKEKCNKEMVIKCCNEAGIDSEKSGWIAPKVHGVTELKPTPELVHGVAISNPFLANALKQHRFFSGKSIRR